MARSLTARPSSILPPGEALDACYAAARRAAEEAEAEVRQASARHLAGLLRAKPDARFAALADSASVLTPEDRTQLLTSLRGQAAPSRPIMAGTASRWAIWRSRLPYRVVSLTVSGLVLVSGLGLGVLAWHRTPERWVTIAGDKVLSTRWHLPGGGSVEGDLRPGERYVLVRRDGEVGLLRLWSPGHGYAETQVAFDYLR